MTSGWLAEMKRFEDDIVKAIDVQADDAVKYHRAINAQCDRIIKENPDIKNPWSI
jgi:hypothetical protein